MKSQDMKVKEWLEMGNKLTSLDALEFWGVGRLAARVHSLRKEGMPIQSKKITVRNRFGQECIVSQYSVIKEIKQLQLV